MYGTSATLIDKFTYLDGTPSRGPEWQREMLECDVKSALTMNLFKHNPLPYHEMRRGMIIGLGEKQWKPSLGHLFPELLRSNGKLRMLASQNIDGLDLQVVRDHSKVYNPHGLMSSLVSEPKNAPLCMTEDHPIYQRYVQLVKENIRDIYEDRPTRMGRSSHLWPGPSKSTAISLDMLEGICPEPPWSADSLLKAAQKEKANGTYSVKPGSVLFDRTLWRNNAAGERYDAFDDIENCDMLLVMGTSLSGLTIDGLAHSAGRAKMPRIVFDKFATPVQSIKDSGPWNEQCDSFLQGNIDLSILELLRRLNWLQQLFEDPHYLNHLCLNSLAALKAFITKYPGEVSGKHESMVDVAIAKEKEREKYFYPDDVE